MKPPRILIKFPEAMMETLKRRAEENDRSINGEVVHLVRFALNDKRIQDEGRPMENVVEMKTRETR